METESKQTPADIAVADQILAANRNRIDRLDGRTVQTCQLVTTAITGVFIAQLVFHPAVHRWQLLGTLGLAAVLSGVTVVHTVLIRGYQRELQNFREQL